MHKGEGRVVKGGAHQGKAGWSTVAAGLVGWEAAGLVDQEAAGWARVVAG